MERWFLTTTPPEKSGTYLVVQKYASDGSYTEPKALSWSMKHSAWNASDSLPDAPSRFPDLRDKDRDPEFSFVYAWYQPDTPTQAELDALLPAPGKWTPAYILPETSEPVLAFVKKGRYEHIIFDKAPVIASHNEEGGWCLEEYPGAWDFEVTHWMPFPADPEVH